MASEPVHQVHPEVERFRRKFDVAWVPEGVEFQVEPERIRGERRNTDWSRLGLASGALLAVIVTGIGMIWIPLFTAAWIVMAAALIIALPYLGARAALFRYRKGRTKWFTLDFRSGRPSWSSNDDHFWKHVKDFFKV